MDISPYIDPSRKLIVGVGSALIDILCREADEFLTRTGAKKGGMTLVENEFIDRALALSANEPRIVPGGSACNTVVGVGNLGGAARFVGKCGSGDMGTLFRNDLKKHNVDPVLFRSHSPTGRVLSIITPDAQRSMFTFLGASAEAQPEEISAECFAQAAIVHVEGYLLFNPDLITKTLKTAKQAGALVSLDLASFTLVEESRELLGNLVGDYVDILMANEDEALAFSGHSEETHAIQALAGAAKIAVLKVGSRGSYISYDGAIRHIGPKGDGRAVDTTGAGDLWASGFLFGLANGYSFEKSGELGSACGYEVCQVIGADIPEEGWRRIKKLLE